MASQLGAAVARSLIIAGAVGLHCLHQQACPWPQACAKSGCSGHICQSWPDPATCNTWPVLQPTLCDIAQPLVATQAAQAACDTGARRWQDDSSACTRSQASSPGTCSQSMAISGFLKHEFVQPQRVASLPSCTIIAGSKIATTEQRQIALQPLTQQSRSMQQLNEAKQHICPKGRCILFGNVPRYNQHRCPCVAACSWLV